jgi:trehalose 6-phosphate synthase
MSFRLRLVGALWLSTLLVIAGFAYRQVLEERGRLTGDLERRATLLGEGLQEAAAPALTGASRARIVALIKKLSAADQGIAVYDKLGTLIAATPDLAPLLTIASPDVTTALTSETVQRRFRKLGDRSFYVYASPILRDEEKVGALAVLLNAVHLEHAEWALWRSYAMGCLVLATVLSGMALLIVRISVTRPLEEMARWTRTLRGEGSTAPLHVSDASLFGPVAREVSVLAKSFQRARATAEEEATLRLAGETLWTEERLKQFAKLRLGDSPLVVVSNREPFSHVKCDRKIQVQAPASGLVTAMDPVMRACGGVWVAQASGDADRETADDNGRLRVPPDDPRYTLRRVWLSAEEEAGYYYGFANEGLWPLCHIVHTRPQFRPGDWEHYRIVNERFAAAVLEEIAKTESPMVLIQDYHFALLPALIKRERPDARTALFWHIPWPNFEAFSICPWQDDLLLGMLGADLVGFHTQYYCNNFLDTVERAIEARIDWEHFSVSRGQHTTYVKPFPISVAPEFVDAPPATSRQDLLKELGVASEFLAVGVERLDYTKGLPERFRALGRFFERFPEYRERLTFVQLAAPSRTRIARYQELQAEVVSVVHEVNTAFQTKRWRPIVYLERHFQHREIWPFYRHADLCMVTSLHDGMNLVAKEFISAREGDGVLILSQFTGAASELRDALLVNPYDLDGMAEAIRAALEMPGDERRARMARMQQLIREQNIYRWAGRLLSELSRIPGPALSSATSGK